jgi:hypothetical protein
MTLLALFHPGPPVAPAAFAWACSRNIEPSDIPRAPRRRPATDRGGSGPGHGHTDHGQVVRESRAWEILCWKRGCGWVFFPWDRQRNDCCVFFPLTLPSPTEGEGTSDSHFFADPLSNRLPPAQGRWGRGDYRLNKKAGLLIRPRPCLVQRSSERSAIGGCSTRPPSATRPASDRSAAVG